MVPHGLLLPTRLSVMSSDDDPTLAAKTDSQIVGLAERAEALGFESVWVGDSVLAKPRHEPLTTLAAIAGATDAVTLGTAVYLSNLRDPVNIAHLTATVDQLSGGRLALGVGTGSAGSLGSSVEAEYREMGVPWADRGRMLDEQLDVVTELWTGEPIEYDGEFYQYDGASIGFSPVGDPPIYVGSAVHPEKGVVRPVRERVAAHGDGWFPGMAPPDVYEMGFEQVAETVDAAGRDPTDLTKVYYQDVVIADTQEEALARERAFTEAYYPGIDITDEQLLMRGAFGPPEVVAEELARYEAAGIDHVVTRFPQENQYEQLERFAQLLG